MPNEVSTADSILASTKKLLLIDDGNTDFDIDIITDINTVLASLIQMGIGPQSGYEITGRENTWNEFIGDNSKLNAVKTLVALRVRKIFDPPQSSILMNALEENIKEYEWRVYIEKGGY